MSYLARTAAKDPRVAEEVLSRAGADAEFADVIAERAARSPEFVSAFRRHSPSISQMALEAQRLGGFSRLRPRDPDVSDRQITKDFIPKLRNLSKTFPVYRAIQRISRQVRSLSWNVAPPPLEEDVPAIKIRRATRNMRRPYTGLTLENDVLAPVIEDIFTLGYGAIERQQAEKADRDHYFYFRPMDAGRLRKNAKWKPEMGDSVHRYVYLENTQASQGVPYYDSEVILLGYEPDTWKKYPVSPVEICMELIESWLGLAKWQRQTTSRAAEEYILNVKNASQDRLDAFKLYYQTEIQGTGNLCISSFEDVKAEKVGARDDEGLFLEYQERVTGFVAAAFAASRQDYNLIKDINKAVAKEEADAVFDQAVRPMALYLSEAFNMGIMEPYVPGLEFTYVDVDPRRDSEEAKRVTGLFQNTLLEANEARQMNGLPPKKIFKDVYMIPKNMDLVRPTADGRFRRLTEEELIGDGASPKPNGHDPDAVMDDDLDTGGQIQ